MESTEGLPLPPLRSPGGRTSTALLDNDAPPAHYDYPVDDHDLPEAHPSDRNRVRRDQADERSRERRPEDRPSSRTAGRASGRDGERVGSKAAGRTGDRPDERTGSRTGDRASSRSSGRNGERVGSKAAGRGGGRGDERAAGRSDERAGGRSSERAGRTGMSAGSGESAGRGESAGSGGGHRIPAPPGALRGRVAVAAVAIGAIAAAAGGSSLLPHVGAQTVSLGNTQEAAAIIGANPDNGQSLEVRPAARVIDPAQEAQQLAATARITGQGTSSVDQIDQTAPGTSGEFAKPAAGNVVSTFGGQYGTFHYGIEIANTKNTPIVAAAAGTIIAAGPTSGFGMWVKERLTDGTVLVYARMTDFSVHVGQQVQAGQQIARMGDRGFGSGYTLHFEVWQPNGQKIDPEQWLNTRGITV
jgi:murein DD-endopeptidase MepM/ murein hydrolase activator NlpD